jgi:hypothetical protein
VSLDIYVDELPVQRKSIFVATSEEVVNASMLSENRPISFKPFQSARFLVVKEGGLDDRKMHKIVIMSKLEGFQDIAVPFTFSDRIAGYQMERIYVPSDSKSLDSAHSSDRIFKNFTSPLILSGKKAYVVCSSNGSLSAPWTWMGVRYDNGGLYVPPVRAFGRIFVEVSIDEGVRKRLPNFVVSSVHDRGSLETDHEIGGLHVRRKLTVPLESRGFIMTLDLKLVKSANGFRKQSARMKKEERKVRLHFLIDGNITSYGLAAISQSNTSKFNSKESCLQIGSARTNKKEKVQYFGTIGVAPKSLKPSKILTDSFDNDLELSYDVDVQQGKTIRLALIGTGSFVSAVEGLREFRVMRDNYNRLVQETEASFDNYSSTTLNVRPAAENESDSISRAMKAYEKAKACLQYLKGGYDGLGLGICAGLPRFPNYWARDTGWSLRGYLSIGDYSFARSVIDNFLRRQAKNNTKFATKGELPMIISGRAFLHNTTYGSADSTFLFPWAIREYVLGTGDVSYLQKRWESMVALIDYGLSKDIDGDGFVEHGFTGTAEKLPIGDSTWMDHIDRRKNANDIQALFYESLVIGSELAGIVGDSNNEDRWKQNAEQLRAKIKREYWNGNEGFYYDTIRRDGSKDSSIRPNSLVLLLTNAENDRSRINSVLQRIEKDDMTTSWGIRTLSSLDAKYRPNFYHDGAVWPLVTGWAAVCELQAGRREQAFSYITSMADRILAENGMFAETYRGDRPEPFNSCILQAWSVGMYVYALKEMMLGMSVNMLKNSIRFDPQFPESVALKAPLIFEHSVPDKGRFKVSVDTSNRKISVAVKKWKGHQPEFIGSASYSIVVHNA